MRGQARSTFLPRCFVVGCGSPSGVFRLHLIAINVIIAMEMNVYKRIIHQLSTHSSLHKLDVNHDHNPHQGCLFVLGVFKTCEMYSEPSNHCSLWKPFFS